MGRPDLLTARPTLNETLAPPIRIFGRYTSVSGVVSENLLLASATYDYKASLTLEPGKLGRSPANREPVLIGRVELSAIETVASKRYDTIPHRHLNRIPCS